MIQCNIYTKYIKRLTNTLRVWTFHCNCPYISHLKKELPDITATKLQMNFDLSQIWFSAIYAPNLSSVWQTLFEFEHFNAIFPFSVISMKNYQISLQLNIKLSVINLKFEFIAINAPNLLSVWQIHFEFEHLIAIDLLSVILTKNY